MGIVNYGNQILSFDYQQKGTAKGFNKLNYKITQPGIYKDGLLSYVNSSTVQFDKCVMYIEDNTNKLGIRIETEDLLNITVDVTTPYIIARFTWVDSVNNYADIIPVDFTSILEDDLVIGKCVYDGSNVLQTNFDYSLREEVETYANTTVYNITTSSNEVYALPDANTVKVQYIVKRRGDGTGLVTFTTESSQTIDTEIASNLELSGESSIILIPKSGNWESVKTGGASGTVVGVAGETISKDELVFFHTDSKVYLGNNQELAKSILSGFAVNDAAIDEAVTIQSNGVLEEFSGLTIGTQYFLGNSANIIVKGSIDYSEYIVSIGVAISATEIDVKISLPESTRNQDDGNPVGSVKYFGTSKDRSAYGYLPFAFDNAISQTNYSVLYTEIGDIYEAQHIAAGDSASGVGMFYPTPIPGAYDRAGIPDIDYATGDVSGNALINITHHITRDGTPFKIIGDDVPAPLVSNTEYFIIVNSATSISFATTEANAVAGTVITLTDSGSGTFRLTQEGIVLNDAMQQITGEALDNTGRFAASSGALSSKITGSSVGAANGANTSYGYAFDSADSPDARTTNETRPITNYSFPYMKVEHVTSAGEPISALRYDTGWISPTTFDALDITVTHNLGAVIADLDVKLFVSASSDGSSAIIDVGSVLFDKSTSTDKTYGFSIVNQSSTENEFEVRIGTDGLVYIGSSGAMSSIPDTWYYKVIVTKPNLINTVFDVSSMPKTYDLTSANVTKTLPEISGVMQTISFYWTNGGTYKLTLAVTDGATVGGETAGTWEGEGNGHILVESDGSNWQVREYEDSGVDGDGEWGKQKDGVLIQKDVVSKNNGTTSAQVFDYLKPFCPGNKPALSLLSGDTSHSTWINMASYLTTNQWSCVVYYSNGSGLSTSVKTVSMQAIGRWRT